MNSMTATKAPPRKAAAKKTAPKKTEAPKPAIFSMATRAFIRCVTEASVFAGTDVTLPMLCAVRLTLKDGKLNLAATDRYVMGVVTENVETDATISQFLLMTADVRRLVKLLRPEWRGSDPLLRITVADNVMTVEQPSDATDLPPLAVSVAGGNSVFPAYHSLFPTEEIETGPPMLGLNPVFLARFAKVARHNVGGMRVKFGATANKPITVTIGDHFVGLIMPMRLGDGVSTIADALARVA